MFSMFCIGKEPDILKRLSQKPPVWIRKWFPELIWAIPNNNNNVYLTFDDGPDPEVTPGVLDILARFDVRATFFCLGRNVEKYPEIFDRIQQEGHIVGNHSYSHPDGWRTGKIKYVEDIERAAKLIPGTLFRPPYGRIRPIQIKALKEKYQIVMWDFMCWDFKKQITKGDYLINIEKFCRTGSIVVFHDTNRAWGRITSELACIIDWFEKKGFQLKKLIY